MFWDASGKIGIFNSETLIVSSIIPLISKADNDIVSSGSVYNAMIEYFL